MGASIRSATNAGRVVLDLAQLGWDEGFAAAFEPHGEAGLRAGRIAIEHRGGYLLASEDGEVPARVSGRFRHAAGGRGTYPAVGDWVAYQTGREGGPALIHHLLPRRTVFSRKAAGRQVEQQIIAANVDLVLIVSSLRTEVNPRRIERALVLAWESGADPIILLSQADLCPDPEEARRAVEGVAVGVPIHVISSLTGQGLEDLPGYFRPNRTGVLLGTSGAGKSTLINRLTGRETLRTQEVRDDGKGRHTTTHRELIPLPGGGLIIDTPGLREIQLWEGAEGPDGVADTFDDVEDLAARCRFADCRHEAEPGCAVLAAVAEGRLAADRLASYHKLQRELRHLEARQDQRAQIEGKQQVKAVMRGMKAFQKQRGR